MLVSIVCALSAFAAAEPAHAQDRFAVGAQFAVHNLPELGETRVGYGFRLTYAAYLPFISFDAEFNSFPTGSSGNLGETQGFLGLKAGVRVGRWGVFGKARPGIANFGGGAFPNRITGATHFALDLGGGVEYYPLPHIGLRMDLSDVGTFFGNTSLRAGPGTPPGVPLHTQHNFETTTGVVLTF